MISSTPSLLVTDLQISKTYVCLARHNYQPVQPPEDLTNFPMHRQECNFLCLAYRIYQSLWQCHSTVDRCRKCKAPLHMLCPNLWVFQSVQVSPTAFCAGHQCQRNICICPSSSQEVFHRLFCLLNCCNCR